MWLVGLKCDGISAQVATGCGASPSARNDSIPFKSIIMSVYSGSLQGSDLSLALALSVNWKKNDLLTFKSCKSVECFFLVLLYIWKSNQFRRKQEREHNLTDPLTLEQEVSHSLRYP